MQAFEARPPPLATGTDGVVRVVGTRVPLETIVAAFDAGATEGRVVLTHDVSTLIARAYDRVRAGQSMPGVIAVPQSLAVGQVIEDLLLVVQCSVPADWTQQVAYLPLQ